MRYRMTMCAICVHQFLAVGLLFGEEPLRPSFLMLAEPAFDETPGAEEHLPEGIVELWRSSLRRPEAFTRQSAAVDIRDAHRAGFLEVKTAIPELRELLRDESAGNKVRAAVIQALIELDAREASQEMFGAAQGSGQLLRQLVEPVLAEWEYQPIQSVWRERLGQSSVSRRELLLACNGSGRVRDELALTALLAIVHDSERPRDIRLSAARAAGEIADNGLEAEVRKLLSQESPPLIQRLCAISLLKRHDSEESQKLLVEMFRDPAGPVASAAIERLLAIDPALVLELVPPAWEHPDVKVRRAAAECLIALPTPERMAMLAAHLHDPNPALRVQIREALLAFAQQSEFETVVRQSVVEVLQSDDWRGQEQACLILGQLDHEMVAPRLLEMMKSDRPGVMIASAWALRKIEVKEVLPDMLEQAQRQTDRPHGADLTAVDRQVAHLFEAMAIMDYRPAIPLMRRHVPKELTHRRLCRGAAVWALGRLLVDANDEQLAAQLMVRIQDIGLSAPPELDIVRRMSAIALGTMKSASQLQALKSFAGAELGRSPMDESLRWAIRELSGEVVPYRDLPPRVLREWRIQPAQAE